MPGAMETLTDIPVTLDEAKLRKRLGAERPGTRNLIRAAVERAMPLIKARAVFKVAYVEDRPADGVVLDGVRLTSGALRKHLEKVERVFPYVVTIGRDLEEEMHNCEDTLDKYFLDGIGNLAVVSARLHLEEELKKRFALEGISTTSPGSLVDWPMGEQVPLFSILGDVENAVGVSLTKAFVMIPQKSISGIYFPTEVRFYNCQLCRREGCPSRQAAFDEHLAREFGVDH